jgi:segregation and condensation protein B
VIRKAGKKKGTSQESSAGGQGGESAQAELGLPEPSPRAVAPDRATDPEGPILDDADVGSAFVAPETAADPVPAESDGEDEIEQAQALTHEHLRGLLEALVFASDKPILAKELARLASAPIKQVKELMAELHDMWAKRGITLDEVAGGWLFRTAAVYAPFVRELAGGRPVRLSRAQIETLAIAAYRQPITRPEIDEIRGVDSGATLKLLLERDLVRILGKKDEPGRPILYGTTTQFLEFFGLKSLRDLPALREFTELSDDSRRAAEAELGEVLPDMLQAPPAPVDLEVHDTLPPPPAEDSVSDLDAVPNGVNRPDEADAHEEDGPEEDANDL